MKKESAAREESATENVRRFDDPSKHVFYAAGRSCSQSTRCYFCGQNAYLHASVDELLDQEAQS